MSQWIACKDEMPLDMQVVIVRYKGCWPGLGNGGVIDLYAYAGKWFNHPDGVEITHWMPMDVVK